VHRPLEADFAAGDPKEPLPTTDDTWIGSEFHAPTNGVLIIGESTCGDGP
jgi:hypothetical protein